MKTTPRTAAPDSRKEGTMNDNKLTILYERLSHEDGRENESLSIEHQKEYLEEYATRNGFTNFVHRTDDGWSGTRWDRPGFLQIMEDIERGKVGQILIKDMSRLGRDHLRVGLFLEQLRERGVRLIAVAEGIDTAKGEDDFMPFSSLRSGTPEIPAGRYGRFSARGRRRESTSPAHSPTAICTTRTTARNGFWTRKPPPLSSASSRALSRASPLPGLRRN